MSTKDTAYNRDNAPQTSVVFSCGVVSPPCSVAHGTTLYAGASNVIGCTLWKLLRLGFGFVASELRSPKEVRMTAARFGAS